MKKILRVTAAVVTAMSFATGVVSAQTGTLSTTGPDSHNEVENKTTTSTSVNNNNSVAVRSTNPQEAETGSATVSHNTTAGDATSGDASNSGMVKAALTLNNTSVAPCGCVGAGAASNASGSIDHTGPDSHNEVENTTKTTTTVNNNNVVTVETNNTQEAESGNAKVSGNTTGGNATSGSASNVSTTELTLTINN